MKPTKENLKVGDKVILNPASKYIYQQENSKYGVVSKINAETEIGLNISVYWENKDNNTYSYEDLLFYEQQTEFPIPPIIKGEKYHLEAFQKDLEKLGFYFTTTSYYEGCSIRSNKNGNFTTIKEWKEFTYSPRRYTKDTNYMRKVEYINFQLPQQWNEALEHCKNFLEHPFWNHKKEETLTIKCASGDFTVKVSKDKVEYEDTIFTVEELQKIYDFATIAIDSISTSEYRVMFPLIDIGCKKSIPISEIEKIIDTYKKLNS